MTEQERLVTQNMGYVVTLARQYKSDILSTDDLVSEGAIGLMKAARKFDPSRQKPFVTFAAPFIRRSIEAAIRRLDTDQQVRSTDESLPVGSHNNYTLLNVLEDTNAKPSDSTVEVATLSEAMLQAMDVLDERQQEVIRRYYGINVYDPQPMYEIARDMQLKRERVRQIRDAAMRKLKKATRNIED